MNPSSRARCVFVAIAVMLTGCLKQEVTDADREVLVCVSDLSGHASQHPNAARYEKFSKQRYFDGSYELGYEYEPPDSGPDQDDIFLTVTASVEPKRSDALMSHSIEKIGTTFGLKRGGIVSEPIKDFYPFGDESNFSVLKKSGVPVGNMFTARAGNRVYSILIIGAYFDEAEEWGGFVSEKLKRFSSYQPRSGSK